MIRFSMILAATLGLLGERSASTALAQQQSAPTYRRRISEFSAFEKEAPIRPTSHDDGWIVRVEGAQCRVSPSGIALARLGRIAAGAPEELECIQLQFEGASPEACVIPLEPQIGESHHLAGCSSKSWAPAIARYGKLRIEAAYPQVAIEVYLRSGALEYDVLAENSDALRQVRIRVQGSRAIRLTEDGALIVDAPLGPLVQRAPKAMWASTPEAEAACNIQLVGADVFGFQMSESLGAVRIDPQLEFGTYLGGLAHEESHAIAVDALGASFVTGFSGFTDFPTTPGSYKPSVTINGAAFVTKLTPDGSQLAFSTYLGYGDMRAICVAPNGFVVAGGRGLYTGVSAESFPTTPNAIYPTVFLNGNVPAFCALNSSGSALAYGTYLGGILTYVEEIWVDSSNVLAAGGTTGPAPSHPFPLTPGPLGILKGGTDVFAFRFSLLSLQIQSSSVVGGTSNDSGYGFALRPDGAFGVVGRTISTDYPISPGAPQSINNSTLKTKLIVGVINSTATALEWSSYWGGTQPGNSFASDALACGFDASGALTFAGTTNTKDFPTTSGAWKPIPPGSPVVASETFVSRFAPNGTSVQFSTVLVNGDVNYFRHAIVAPDGTTIGTGFTNRPDYPVTPGAFKTTQSGGAVDPVVAQISADGSAVLYGTYLGGGFETAEEALAIARDTQGSLYVTGYTNSPNFPVTPSSFDPTYNAGFNMLDAWIVKLTPPVNNLPGLAAYGAGTPGCDGPHLLAAHSTPKLNNPYFALTCTGAPRGANGILIYSSAPEPVGVDSLGIGALSHIQFLGASLGWLDLSAPPQGTSTTKLPIPNSPHFLGLKVYAQAFWLWPASQPCPQLPFGLSSSNGLEIVIQN
ncbi:MAG: SBBP repeat-containing protein [Planctomycetes bacterium]|nr:SBBP repeat-containing protein [Planctomycetota bacterium]